MRVLDDKTIAIPDLPGNNRLDTLTNMLHNPQVGLLFMIPGMNETLRVNGTVRLVRDADLLESMAFQGKRPSSPSWWIFRKCSPTAPRPSCGPNYGRLSPRSIAVSCLPSPKSSGITRPLGSATWTSCSVNSTTERSQCCISVMAERTWLYGGRSLRAWRVCRRLRV